MVFPPQPSDSQILVSWPCLKRRFPIIPVIQMQLSCRFYLAVTFLALRRNGSWSQIIDQTQDFPEQCLRHGNLGQLERDIPAMADHFRTDLHQLFP